jgi:NADPH-ferrihemoprotein reductase
MFLAAGLLGPVGVALLVASLATALLLNWRRAAPAVASPAKAKAAADAEPAAAPAAPADARDRCTLLFGTQTGTAERFAKSLRSQLDSKYGAHTTFDVVDLESYAPAAALPREKLVLLLLATYGDGEPTDNAADFCAYLTARREALEAAQSAGDAPAAPPLRGVSFAVFGLGNRQYEHFCAVGRRVDADLAALGAARVAPAGAGDDDDDLDKDFEDWSAALFAALEASPLLRAGEAAVLTPARVPAYAVELLKDRASRQSADPEVAGGSGAGHASPLLARVLAVRELHGPASDRSCVHVELDVSAAGAGAYRAGDHVGVFPENAPDVVAAAAAALGLDLGAVVRLRAPGAGAAGGAGASALPPPPEAGPATVRRLLARHTDLLSAPSKSALVALAAFASDPAEAARLRHLASLEGRDAFHAYVVEPKRSLLCALRDHPSARPGLGAFLASVAPRLQPRFYSISSSPAAHPAVAHVTALVVEEAMPSGRLHRGVASSWLAARRPGDAVPAFLRASAFKLPPSHATPLVMVGPGTGLAPFRGFVQERAAAAAAGAALGPALLFFGCRRAEADYIYREELEAAVAPGGGGALTALHVAFSRAGEEKDYVQHRLAAAGAAVWAAVRPEAGGRFYICGDAKAMAADVQRALVAIAAREGGLAPAEAEAYVRRMAEEGRLLKDVW